MSSIPKWTIFEPYISVSGTLLEGPFYDRRRNEFRFVDIWKHKLYSVDLAKGPQSLKTLDTSESIGVTANIANGSESHKEHIVVAAKYGFALVNRTTGELSYIARPWDEPDKLNRMRFNDGAVDSRGRLWAGAMNDPKVQNPVNEGVLFRLDPSLKLSRMVEQDDPKRHWLESCQRYYVLDRLTYRRVHFDIGEPKEPDGFAIDIEGCIWSAVYGGGKVIRISPQGKVIGEILLPTRNITCPAFVGTELFITTAKDDTNDDRFPESIQYGGHLYRVDVGVQGQPKHEFHINQ